MTRALISPTAGLADALMQTFWSKGAAISGVTESLTANHVDQILSEGLHEHTWTVTAYFPSIPFRDGRALKLALREMLDALPSDGVLPDHLWSGEQIAQAVLMLPWTIAVRVWRPEGYEAVILADMKQECDKAEGKI
jgi:hypothetical protein